MRRTTDEYVELITPFHIHRPKFTDTVDGVTSSYVKVGNSALDLPEAFDLDSAIGVQLDTVGKWIGKARFVLYPFETFYFSWEDHRRGWDISVWEAPYEAELGQYRLADEDFRQLLYAQIGVNYWDGTRESAESTLMGFYRDTGLSPGSLFFFDDRGDTSSVFGVSGTWPPPMIMAMLAWPSIDFDVSGYTLRTLVTSVEGTPMFGFDVTNQYIAGWDAGSWGVPPSMLLVNRGDPTSLDFSDPINSGLIGGVT